MRGSGTYLWKGRDVAHAEDWIYSHGYDDPVILVIKTAIEPVDIRAAFLVAGEERDYADQFWGHYVVLHDRQRWLPEAVSVHKDYR